jgi:hypothetical protein
MNTHHPLIKYDAARHALQTAHRVDEAKDIRDKVIALAAYARQASDDQMLCWVNDIRFRAERRTGELLKETISHTGGRSKKPCSAKHRFIPKTLKALHITPHQSADFNSLPIFLSRN